MRKALVRMLDRAYSSPNPPLTAARPSQATLDLLIAHSSGDIRSAVMSLQFLTTEGTGDATSFGAGAKGGKAKKGVKKGKKRKRGDVSGGEDADSSTSYGGKEKVKQLCVFAPLTQGPRIGLTYTVPTDCSSSPRASLPSSSSTLSVKSYTTSVSQIHRTTSTTSLTLPSRRMGSIRRRRQEGSWADRHLTGKTVRQAAKALAEAVDEGTEQG